MKYMDMLTRLFHVAIGCINNNILNTYHYYNICVKQLIIVSKEVRYSTIPLNRNGALCAVV